MDQVKSPYLSAQVHCVCLIMNQRDFLVQDALNNPAVCALKWRTTTERISDMPFQTPSLHSASFIHREQEDEKALCDWSERAHDWVWRMMKLKTHQREADSSLLN